MNIRQLWPSLLFLLLGSFSQSATAQHPAARITGGLGQGPRVALTGSKPPRALAANDLGALSRSTAIHGITLVFSRTPAQETALQALLTAQQTPGSPLYHQWLTPEAFGAQFGMADADLAQAESWLQSQGFTIDRVSRAHDRISFSGTAAQVNTAFNTELHQYRNGSKADFAPSTELSLPAGLAPVVAAVNHLSTFRPKPMVKRTLVNANPAYSVTGTQQHFLTPSDVATMYDVNSLYNAGFNGTGQTIAVAGESYIQTTDVANFQTAAGLKANLPTLVLEPNTGPSAIYEGDEFESDIDTEYAAGMAPGANVLLVYVGDSPNYSAFDAFDYIIEEDLAPVATLSYGSCEPLLGNTYAQAGNALFEQGAAQGQTLIASAGDDGSTPCYGATDDNGNAEPIATQEQLAVSFPASSPYITAIGGTQMAPGTFASGTSQYWATAGTTSLASSLLSYVPEVVWNEDSATYGLASGGGGASILFAAPTWQTGVPGIPAGNTHRLNPDISLQASVASPGYLACSSDPSAFATGQTSSCAIGIYDSTGKFVTAAGGTSFGAPIFAGLVAILNQQQHGAGLGLINPTLYSLAANSTTYASAFHDITTGNNDCGLLTTACSAGLSSFQAGTGYDEASGLGSIDFAKLVAAWPATASSSPVGTFTTLTAATLTPASGATDAISIAITSTTGDVPTGTVTVSLANETAPSTTSTVPSVPVGSQVASLTLNNGQASYTFPGTTTAGTQVVVVKYSGDPAHAASTSSIALTVANTLIPTGAFTMTVSGTVTVPANSYGTATVLVTPTGGYSGLLNFTLPSLPSADCFAVENSNPDISEPIVSGPTTMEIAVGNGAECTSGASVRVGNHMITFPKRTTATTLSPAPPATNSKSTAIALASLLLIGLPFARRRARRLPVLLALFALGTGLSLGLSGCGGGTRSVGGGTTTTPPTSTTSSTLNLTLQGSDSITSSIAASAPVTVIIQ